MGQVIIRAMKQYGIIYADQGAGIYIVCYIVMENSYLQTGVSDTRFAALKEEFNNNIRIPITQFEMVQPPLPIVRGYIQKFK